MNLIKCIIGAWVASHVISSYLHQTQKRDFAHGHYHGWDEGFDIGYEEGLEGIL